MAKERRQDWLDEIARPQLNYPQVKLLAKNKGNPDVPHAAPQIEFGPWVLSGAQMDTFAVIRRKDGGKRAVANPPATWGPPKGEREAGDWLHRIPNVLGRLEEVLAEMLAVEATGASAAVAKRGGARYGVGVETPADLDESSFPEGRVSYRLHARRERDLKLVQSAKERRLRLKGRLECEACDFDFHATYGGHGEGFIEAHHTIPVSRLNQETPTMADDLALVCSNCHRMLHRGHAPTVRELRKMLGKPPRPRAIGR